MAGQIGSLRQELAHLSQAEQARSAEITKRIKELESSVANNTALLAAQTGLLQQLVSAQKEEAARRQLEREKAQFVVRIAALLDTFKDGAVRYLFATKAIEACAARNIKSDSFESLADQKVASEVLNTLATVKLRAIAADRIEAEHFCELTDLRRDISGFRENLLARQDMDDAIRKDLCRASKRRKRRLRRLPRRKRTPH
jgi:hypothetical protein